MIPGFEIPLAAIKTKDVPSLFTGIRKVLKSGGWVVIEVGWDRVN